MDDRAQVDKLIRRWFLIIVGMSFGILVILRISLKVEDFPLHWLIRGAGTIGYLSVFLTSLSSAYMRALSIYLRSPFIQVHHRVAVAGLVMLIFHGGSVAWDMESFKVFLPRFDSPILFLELGGRPAILLVGIASVGAVLRSSLGQKWRIIHWLNYIAFWLGTSHALLIGTTFRHGIIRLVSLSMALGLMILFVWKRLQQRRLRAKTAPLAATALGRRSATG
jgi:sulfoxide reductase heme-binding subunit YedZ